jgi:hypothetical protein
LVGGEQGEGEMPWFFTPTFTLWSKVLYSTGQALRRRWGGYF